MRFRKSPGIVERRIREEWVLVPLAASEDALDSLYTLNETAAFVWERAVEGKMADQIAEELADAYEVSSETARTDVNAVLCSLEEIRALEPVED